MPQRVISVFALGAYCAPDFTAYDRCERRIPFPVFSSLCKQFESTCDPLQACGNLSFSSCCVLAACWTWEKRAGCLQEEAVQ